MDADEPQFLYLTTTGWRSGRLHRIEIWFVEVDGRYYLCSELGERAHWVQNIRQSPRVTVEVRGRCCPGRGRIIRDDEPELIARVGKALDAEYGWSNGLLVELDSRPSSGS